MHPAWKWGAHVTPTPSPSLLSHSRIRQQGRLGEPGQCVPARGALPRTWLLPWSPLRGPDMGDLQRAELSPGLEVKGGRISLETRRDFLVFRLLEVSGTC